MRDVEEVAEGCYECLFPRHLGRPALRLALLQGDPLIVESEKYVARTVGAWTGMRARAQNVSISSITLAAAGFFSCFSSK